MPKKDGQGCSLEFFNNLVGVIEFVSPIRYQFSNKTLSPIIFFNTLGGTAKAPAVDLLRLKSVSV